MKLSRVFAVLCVAAACVIFVAPAWATKYVSLGDSYSSGTGTRTYYDSNCQKSVYSYPYLLHNAHPSWTFVHAACSGAKTSDLLSSQVSSVTSDTNWVSYTIGGNDAGFADVITDCAPPSWASDCDGAINQAQSFINNTLPGQARSGRQRDQVEGAEREGDRARLSAPVQRHGLQRVHLVQLARGDAAEPDGRPAEERHSAAARARGQRISSSVT